MSELIDSFDRLKAEELHKTQAAQKEIVRLLQTLARKLEHMENPSRLNADRLAEMKSDLDFKQMQMGNSASTSERLGQELERRKQELQKIDTLDEKISVELRQLAERMVRARAPRALAAARRRGLRACAPPSPRRPPRSHAGDAVARRARLLVVRLHHRAVARDEVPARRGRLRALCAHFEPGGGARTRAAAADGLRRRLATVARASCTQHALWLK